MINIRSLHANLPILTDYIIEYKPDILALTETWLTENDSNCIYEFLTLNYNFKYITRPDSRFGGVGIIFKDIYKLNKFEKHTLAYSDCLVYNIKINNNTDLNLIVIYRPQGRLKGGGANRAIARGPKFWGAHELFEKKKFYYLYEKKMFLTICLIYY